MICKHRVSMWHYICDVFCYDVKKSEQILAHCKTGRNCTLQHLLMFCQFPPILFPALWPTNLGFNHFTWTILFPLCFRHFHRPKWPLLRRKRLNDHTAYWKSATKENGYVPLGLFALAWFTVHESDQILFAVAKINRIKIFIFISMTCLSYLIRAVASCCQECQKLDAFAGNWGKSSSL